MCTIRFHSEMYRMFKFILIFYTRRIRHNFDDNKLYGNLNCNSNHNSIINNACAINNYIFF